MERFWLPTGIGLPASPQLLMELATGRYSLQEAPLVRSARQECNTPGTTTSRIVSCPQARSTPRKHTTWEAIQHYERYIAT